MTWDNSPSLLFEMVFDGGGTGTGSYFGIYGGVVGGIMMRAAKVMVLMERVELRCEGAYAWADKTVCYVLKSKKICNEQPDSRHVITVHDVGVNERHGQPALLVVRSTSGYWPASHSEPPSSPSGPPGGTGLSTAARILITWILALSASRIRAFPLNLMPRVKNVWTLLDYHARDAPSRQPWSLRTNTVSELRGP
ncbi:hypothetical protein C8R48DRAFT_669634 [Suillus tomentosus]|nr:hypothetical protein C8R48DRAFT_669634 [Suillus tomentosus]